MLLRHELRSPLHGVLAAAEILQSTDLSQYQSSLMDTVNACGRTLLDTMNQVLDYSKILSLEKRFRHLDRRRISSLELKSVHRSAAHLDKYTATDLSVLAEEVVDGVCLGHSHIQKSSSSSHVLASGTKYDAAGESSSAPKLDITIDISPNNWVYNIPPGAIRRIIMNIFSNAIKYTEAGKVSLRLEADSSSSRHNTQEDMITLTVADTGKGISEEFLRSKLFVPFIQEDTLASGSGLGLSIVRSLLKPLGGNISFQSKPGAGTTVKVTLPLVRPEHEFEAYFGSTPPPTKERPTVSTAADLLRENHAGRTIAFVNANSKDASNKPPESPYLTDWFGFKMASPSKKPVDLVFLDSLPSEGDTSSIFSDQNSSLLVLSNDYIGHDSIQVETAFGPRDIHIISRPCGPHKLARIVKGCLDKELPLRKITAKPISLPERPSERPKDENTTNENDTSDKETQTPDTAPAGIPESSTNPTSDKPEPSMEKQGPRILVVEDNKINLNLMLAFLKKRGLAALDSAENGKLAVSAVKEEQQGYDIIFMGKFSSLKRPL